MNYKFNPLPTLNDETLVPPPLKFLSKLTNQDKKMKATIGPTGQLSLKPESDIENYALSKWFDDWEEKKVCLNVELIHPNCPNAKTVRNVKAN